MSFYGKIFPTIEKFFRFIKITNPGDTDSQVIDATDANDTFELIGENGIEISANKETKQIIVKSTLANMLLSNAELVYKDNNQNEGTFLKLTFHTVDSGNEEIVYIDVKELNEFVDIQGDNNININIDEQNILQVTLTKEPITTKELCLQSTQNDEVISLTPTHIGSNFGAIYFNDPLFGGGVVLQNIAPAQSSMDAVNKEQLEKEINNYNPYFAVEYSDDQEASKNSSEILDAFLDRHQIPYYYEADEYYSFSGVSLVEDELCAHFILIH